MKKRTLLFRLFCYIACVLGIFFILYESGVRVSDLSPEMVLTLANHNTFNVLVIMLVLMTLQNLFTFIPLILLITINLAIFGFWNGYLYSTFCSAFGSTAIFLSIRYLFPNVFTSTKLERLQKKIKENGFLFVLSGRILPFVPSNLINIVPGLSSMKVWHFVMATTIGNMIYGLVLASTSFSVIAMWKQHPICTCCVIVAIISLYVCVRFYKKRKRVNVV